MLDWSEVRADGWLRDRGTWFGWTYLVDRHLVIDSSEAESRCGCVNHFGVPKAEHETRDAATSWAWARIGPDGWRIYRCPNGDRYHLTTRAARRAA